MKLAGFFASFLVFMGLSAQACPNLTGHFIGSVEGKTLDVVISQKVENGVTFYDWTANGEPGTWVADGVTRTEKGNEEGFDFTYTYSFTCNGDQLTQTYTQIVSQPDKGTLVDINGVITFSLDSTKDLVYNDIMADKVSGEKSNEIIVFKRQ